MFLEGADAEPLLLCPTDKDALKIYTEFFKKAAVYTMIKIVCLPGTSI